MAEPVCHPLTLDRLGDLEALFGGDSITRGCWCMHWRMSARDWKAADAAARRDGFRRRVAAGPPPGLLAYLDGEPAGWVQVSPRADVPRFNAARSGRPLPAGADLERVWAVSCFFLRKDARGRGLMTELARAACAHAARHGATAVEAAAIAPRKPLIWGDGYVGIASALARAGFVHVEQRTDLRSLMRWTP